MFGGKVRFVSFEPGDAAQRGRKSERQCSVAEQTERKFLRLKFTVIAKSVSFGIDFAMG